MPGARRQPRAASQPPLTLGFAGSGKLDQKAVVALLDDLITGRKVNVVYLPVSNDDTTDEIMHVHRWCVANEIPYETFSVEAEVKKDKSLQKIIDGAAQDYEVSDEGAGVDIVMMLESTEEDPVEDGRMLMFFDLGEEVDLDVFAKAEEVEVDAYDMCDDLSQIKHGDEPEPEPEPAPSDEVGERRGRRKSTPEPEPEPGDDPPAGYTKAEQKQFDKHTSRETPLTELKKQLRVLDPSITVDDLKGRDKAYVADLIIITKRNQAAEAAGDPEPADEAQQTSAPSRRRGRGTAAAEEPAQGPSDSAGGEYDGEEAREAVFARLRGSREQAERIAKGMSAVAREQLGLAEDAQEIEIAAGIFAAGMMAFAEYLIVEVRKPKSAGRPRADGTEAQPKPPVDPDAPKRGRGRPRKDAD